MTRLSPMADHQYRDVVVLAGHELAQGPQDVVADEERGFVTDGLHRVDQAIQFEHLAGLVLGLGDAIGVEDEEVAVLEA